MKLKNKIDIEWKIISFLGRVKGKKYVLSFQNYLFTYFHILPCHYTAATTKKLENLNLRIKFKE